MTRLKVFLSEADLLRDDIATMRRDRDRLRGWLRRWLSTAPISLGLNLATKRLRSEINAALNGDAPPKKRAR